MRNFTHTRLKMAVFWVVATCSLVEVYKAIALMMEAVITSETSVNFYQNTRRNNPEDGHLHTRRRENLKSHLTLAWPPCCDIFFI
jgi:hypothetical protein